VYLRNIKKSAVSENPPENRRYRYYVFSYFWECFNAQAPYTYLTKGIKFSNILYFTALIHCLEIFESGFEVNQKMYLNKKKHPCFKMFNFPMLVIFGKTIQHIFFYQYLDFIEKISHRKYNLKNYFCSSN
jgi:hypothetical protein